MPDQKTTNHFGEDQAANYDQQFAKLSPLKDAIHLCARAVLDDAPENARLLCVGAGTGAELLYFAEAFPGWSFTLVEPSGPMLNRCRGRAEEAGIAGRCTFHEGYLDSLADGEPFDVATSILVSQFILDIESRRAYFSEIARRLAPGGRLVTADLATDLPSGETGPSGPLFDHWMALMAYNGADAEARVRYREAVTNHVAILPATDVASLVASSGFDSPVQICQTILIHTWYARRSAELPG